MSADPFKDGERVMLTIQGQSYEARIIGASPSGRALLIGFDQPFAGYEGIMPVLDRDGSGRFFELAEGCEIGIERLQ